MVYKMSKATVKQEIIDKLISHFVASGEEYRCLAAFTNVVRFRAIELCENAYQDFKYKFSNSSTAPFHFGADNLAREACRQYHDKIWSKQNA